MNSKSGIYKITSPSGKIYIGETINFGKRFKRYKGLQCKKQYKLYNSFIKYGVDAHKFEIVEECDIDVLKCRERYWQDYYNVISDNGMNLTLSSCEDVKKVWTEEIITKMTNTLKRNYAEGNIKNAFKGKKHSEETKSKLREINKGDNNHSYGKKGENAYAYGYKHSTETLLKMSEDRKNKNEKIIMDYNTGIFYNNISEIIEIYGYNKSTIRSKLNGQRKNNTNFKYC